MVDNQKNMCLAFSYVNVPVYCLYCLSFVCLPLVLVPENSLSSRDISERRAALKWINTAQMDKHCSQMSAPLPNAVNEENSKREKMDFVQNHLKREKKRKKNLFF